MGFALPIAGPSSIRQIRGFLFARAQPIKQTVARRYVSLKSHRHRSHVSNGAYRKRGSLRHGAAVEIVATDRRITSPPDNYADVTWSRSANG